MKGKKYLSCFTNAIKTGMVYKFEFYMWGINALIAIFMYYYLWRSIFENQSEIHGFTLESMVTYIIVATLINNLLPRWHWGEIANLIRSGDIVMELVKPYNLILKFYFWQMGTGTLFFGMTLVPFIMIGIYFFHLQPPASLIHLLITLISVLLASFISYFLWLFVGLTSFYTTNVWGVYTTMMGINLFLTGTLIPLEFMPDWLEKIIYILPWQNTVYTPVSIYLGKISGLTLIKVLVIQIIWSILLYLILNFYYKLGLKRLVVQGG
ncbi:ABC transporter permease [Orenia marismortui]|uniref:ABC-2 type transport system permease protein n=1 Tax=Orenia marismortui TaxID=46469 RepID=A0A4R8GU24_9FIRM|nr:ABC-2 family transporter protein [Orenia marismortui]TDX48368.1 ABC-2 type transport system permease protein [Orenia marismortui]